MILDGINTTLHLIYPIFLIVLIGFFITHFKNLNYNKKIKSLSVNLFIILVLMTFNLVMWVKRNSLQNEGFSLIWYFMLCFIIYFSYFLFSNRIYFNNYIILLIILSLYYNFYRIVLYLIYQVGLPISSMITPFLIVIGYFFLILDFIITYSKFDHIKKSKYK